MFEFEQLKVYQSSKELYHKTSAWIYASRIDLHLKDQLLRASMSIVLNIAEGAGRVSIADRKYFFVMARSSAYECVAILEIIAEQNKMAKSLFEELSVHLEQISKMLYALVAAQRNRI